MKLIDYSYQDKAAQIVLKNALNTSYKASILAACPNAGKTTISHKIINNYISMFPKANIVVLTEGQNTLKNQYLNELNTPNVDIKFTYGSFGSGAQVQVGLPQSINNLKWDKIDLILVDEAHNFYLADMVQSIIKKLNPKHQILMTGSPTKYNLYNKDVFTKNYGIHYIAADELKEMGVFSPVDVDVAKVSYKKNPTQTIREVLSQATLNNDNLSKIMVACPNISYARQVGEYLISIGRKVSLSTSKNDKNDIQIQKFKSGETDTLIVVGKGVLGFNDKNMTFLADLRSSSNLDTSYQLFARVLRTHPEGIRKTYYRVADSDYNKQVITLHKMISLMQKDIFKGFTGNNIKLEMI